MIAAIQGIIFDKIPTQIIIQTAAGIFYEILISDNVYASLPDIGENIILHTSLIVREQEMSLIGFRYQDEKKLFEILITAKGVGPKQAMKILNEFSPDSLRIAIVSEDISRLSSIKGLSLKKSEQLILDLKEKIKKTINEQILSESQGSSKIKTEILLTMRALGYTDSEIKKPLDLFFNSHDISSHSVESLVSMFLSQLSLR